jgi:hypothetical protein
MEKLSENHFDSLKLIHDLSTKIPWDDHDLTSAKFLSSKLEISGKLFLTYASDGKKSSSFVVKEEGLKLALPVLKKLLNEVKTKASYYKVCNAYYKLVDRLSENQQVDGLSDQGEFPKYLDANLRASDAQQLNKKILLQPYKKERQMDLTVLFWEGPIARAYLEMLKFMNIKPKKIIHLISNNDISTGKPNSKWMPKNLKPTLYASKQFQSISYWPSKLKKTEREQYVNIKNTVSEYLGITDTVFDDAYKSKPLENYSDNVKSMLVDNIKDPAIVQQLGQENGNVLFTGGGILTKQYFEVKNINFIHIHPGYLPEIRGSDGVLWSMLLNGYPSGSCFFMTPNLDDGEVIHRNFLGIDFDMSRFSTKEYKDKYRMLFSYIDPWVRACILAESIVETELFKSIQAIKQDESSSNMFYTMHSELQRNVL